MNPYIITADPSQKNINIMTKDEFDQKENYFPIEDCQTLTEAKEKAALIQKIGILNYLANYVTN